jgi:2-keto-3-deoxy-L-rhamnonate aldolase RhmA
MDRTNDVRRALTAGDPVVGAGASTFAPEVVETYGALGLDFVWLDFEHDGPAPQNARLLNDLSRAADCAGTELLVRLPSEDPHLVRKTLDAGARNVLIPRVKTAEQVRTAAAATRFRHDGAPGERGVAQARVTTWGSDDDGYVDEEDEQVALGAMVESAAAVENLDAILDVPALSFCFVGPADLSVSLGHPNERDHPEVRETVADVEARVAESDVALAGIANSPAAVADARERGYDLLRIGGDLAVLRSALGDRVDAVREAL